MMTPIFRFAWGSIWTQLYPGCDRSDPRSGWTYIQPRTKNQGVRNVRCKITPFSQTSGSTCAFCLFHVLTVTFKMAAPMSHGIWRKKLNEHHLFDSLRENKEKQRPPKECRKLLAIKDGEIFVWDAYRTCLLTTNLKSLAQKQENPCQVKFSRLFQFLVKRIAICLSAF